MSFFIFIFILYDIYWNIWIELHYIIQYLIILYYIIKYSNIFLLKLFLSFLFKFPFLSFLVYSYFTSFLHDLTLLLSLSFNAFLSLFSSRSLFMLSCDFFLPLLLLSTFPITYFQIFLFSLSCLCPFYLFFSLLITSFWLFPHTFRISLLIYHCRYTPYFPL